MMDKEPPSTDLMQSTNQFYSGPVVVVRQSPCEETRTEFVIDVSLAAFMVVLIVLLVLLWRTRR